MDEENLRIKDAAVVLNINYQTAKSIIRRFRATGKIQRSNRILKYANDDEDGGVSQIDDNDRSYPNKKKDHPNEVIDGSQT